MYRPTPASVFIGWGGRFFGQTWHALDYIQGDPATLETAKARIDQFFQQFDGEPLTSTTILGDWSWINSYKPNERGTAVFQADGQGTFTEDRAGGTDIFSGTWELVGNTLSMETDDGDSSSALVFGNSDGFTWHTGEFPLTFSRQ